MILHVCVFLMLLFGRSTEFEGPSSLEMASGAKGSQGKREACCIDQL